MMLCLYAQLVECDVEVSDQAWQDPRHVLHHYHCRPTGRMPSALFDAGSKVSLSKLCNMQDNLKNIRLFLYTASEVFLLRSSK